MIFAHAGDFGDTIYCLPALRELEHPADLVLYPGQPVREAMDEGHAGQLLPLLNSQRGIRAEWRPHPPDPGLKLDTGVRRFYNGAFNLADMYNHWLGLEHWHREVPWLTVDRPEFAAQAVISRSFRYRHDPGFPWARMYEQLAGRAVFVGLADEHADFVAQFGPIPHHPTPDLLEVARVIAGADVFLGNQSCPRAIAEGLKVPVLVEESNYVANTHWARTGAWYSRDFAQMIPSLTAAELERVWCAAAARRSAGRTVSSLDRLERLARLTRRVRQSPGAVAELGVTQGGSTAVLAWCLPHKRVFAIDTFAGHPADDVFADGHKAGEFAADPEAVRRFLRMYDVELVIGRFPAVTPAAEEFCFVHVDADLYASTRAAIEWFRPRMVPGGLIVFDDYNWQSCPGVRRAIKEAELPVEVAGTQAWYVAPVP